MHFFRRSKIHIDCFTFRRDVIEYAPIVNAIETIPNWWINLPKEAINPLDGFSPTPTMKTCVGMYDYYAKSIAMPLWSELCVNVLENDLYNWQFSDLITKATVHTKIQYTGFLDNTHYGHLKILSPWLIATKENINWMMSDPIYSHTSFRDYTLAQGLLNFSKQHGSNLQIFLDIAIPRKFIVPFGKPFLFTPLTDKKVVVHRHLITKDAYESKELLAVPTTFINKYKNYQKLAKCPFKDKT